MLLYPAFFLYSGPTVYSEIWLFVPVATSCQAFLALDCVLTFVLFLFSP